MATEALSRKSEADNRISQFEQDAQMQEDMADKLQSQVEKLKSTIATHENELISLRARAKTAAATKKSTSNSPKSIRLVQLPCSSA